MEGDILKPELLRNDLEKLLNEKGYHLYDLNCHKEDGNIVLEVVLDEHLDLNEITKVSQDVSELMDEIDKSEEAYLLDVHCAGLERALRNPEEVNKAVYSYICITTKDGELYGDLISFDGNELTISYKDKNITKKKTLSYAEVIAMRTAVKF